MKRCASFLNFEFMDNLFSIFFARWIDTSLILSFNKFSKGSMSFNPRYACCNAMVVWHFLRDFSADYLNTKRGQFCVELRDSVSSQGHFLSFVTKSRLKLSCRFSWIKELSTLCIGNLPCRKLKKLKTTIFSSGHLINSLNIPHVQKWLPFGKIHERLVIVEFKIGASL